MRVLVTGGAGFIGTYTTAQLIAEGHEPVVFDIASQIWEDVRDEHAVARAVGEVDAVIHLAAILGTQETIADPCPVVETNLQGSLNVFEAAGDKPVVYISVGNAWMRSLGTGAYTISKTCVEDFVVMYNKHRGHNISVVRPVNAYGPGQSVVKPWGTSNVRKIIPTFIHQALSGGPVEVYGDGRQVSDCVYVGDVARALVWALHEPRKVLGIGPIESRTVGEIARMVANKVDPKVEIAFLPMRPGEVPGKTCANRVPLEDTGFDMTLVGIHEGLERTITYYRDRWQG